MAEIRPVEARDFAAICEFLHTHMNKRFSPERWHQLFEPQWCAERPDLGLVVEDQGRIVGFHGHICSTRFINGRRERFTNFSSWYLMKEYRGTGLGSAMVRRATEAPETTFTVFSLSPKRIEMFSKLGLTQLESERYLWKKLLPDARVTVETDPQKILFRVNPHESDLLERNLGYPVKPYLLSTCCDQCLLIINEAQKGDDVTYYDILYRGNETMFSTHTQAFANAILPDTNAVLAADKRFCNCEQPTAEIERIKSPRFYKSPRVQPADVDLLCSELQLLDMKLD